MFNLSQKFCYCCEKLISLFINHAAKKWYLKINYSSEYGPFLPTTFCHRIGMQVKIWVEFFAAITELLGKHSRPIKLHDYSHEFCTMLYTTRRTGKSDQKKNYHTYPSIFEEKNCTSVHLSTPMVILHNLSSHIKRNH